MNPFAIARPRTYEQASTLLLEDRFSLPASGTVEFCDDVLPIRDPDVVDAVLQRIQCKAVTGRPEAARFDRLQHPVRRQAKEELVAIHRRRRA